MKIFLAIDTSESYCSVALQANSKKYHLQKHAPREHTQIIWPLINNLISQANITPQQITHVICTNGPGSFTGIRVASSIAQGIAVANNCLVIPVSTLECLADAGLMIHPNSYIWALMDAKMQGVYSAIYSLENNTKKVIQHAAALRYEELRSIKPKSFYAVGSGWEIEQTKTLLTNNLMNTKPVNPLNLLNIGISRFDTAINAVDFKLKYLRGIN